ncbi:MAG: DUF2314 domain-containing protein [Nocardioides sp.]|uniref:hypothetical protein n=1 Tax=Nocardioides sp. TaxID=35761 RepID=UPI0039E3EF64
MTSEVHRLANAEERQAESPTSFVIPSVTERASLGVGDLAKLIFELADVEETPAERMWVIVTQVVGGRYVGRLDNQPVAMTALNLGDTVSFGPEHVIDTGDDPPLVSRKVLRQPARARKWPASSSIAGRTSAPSSSRTPQRAPGTGTTLRVSIDPSRISDRRVAHSPQSACSNSFVGGVS